MIATIAIPTYSSSDSGLHVSFVDSAQTVVLQEIAIPRYSWTPNRFRTFSPEEISP
jgi:hypothetical protein